VAADGTPVRPPELLTKPVAKGNTVVTFADCLQRVITAVSVLTGLNHASTDDLELRGTL